MPEGETAFFADLGTNGELVYGSRDGFVSASAPAGPAFEGGSLSCGMPGMPGYGYRPSDRKNPAASAGQERWKRFLRS